MCVRIFTYIYDMYIIYMICVYVHMCLYIFLYICMYDILYWMEPQRTSDRLLEEPEPNLKKCRGIIKNEGNFFCGKIYVA